MGRKKTQKTKRSSNEGCLHHMKSGKWRCVLSAGYNDDGTRKRLTKVFDTENEAREWKTKQLSAIQDFGVKAVVAPSDCFVSRYHSWLIVEKMPAVYPQSFSAMMSHFNNYIKPYFRNNKQKDLGHKDFQDFFNALEHNNVSADTRRRIKCVLGQYFKKEYAGTPISSPLDGIKTIAKKTFQILDPNEVIFSTDEYKAVPKELRQQFLDALDKDNCSKFLKPLCYLMYFAGNRVGETLAYQWKDFNFERRYFACYKAVTITYDFDENGNKISKAKTVVKAPKTQKGIRPLPLLDILYEVLMEWREYRKAQERVLGISFTAPDDYVFANNKGGLRSRDGATTLFSRFLKRHNLQNKGIHFHALRQTFSNALFAEDSEEKVITDLLGHTKISTSKQHYNSIEKFDSVQKAARLFNEKFKPKDSKYCASESATFAPDGYLTEQDTPVLLNIVSTPSIAPNENNNRLMELLGELATYPEFQELIAKAMNNIKEGDCK